jgi:glycosyltransferase involved in cell wall biosynthesis
MFSIVVPLWNKQRLVSSTVASVLAQSVQDFELIIVDDGSTDGSLDRLAAFDDPRITILAQPNAGPGAARNRGIEAARHDWIALLDADDIWLPDHLAELDRVRRLFPRSGLIATAFVCSNRQRRDRRPASADAVIEPINYFERIADGEWDLLCTSTSAIPKSTYEDLGGFSDDVVAQDVEYWSRVALERPVAVSRRVTVVYRVATGGISDTAQQSSFGKEWRGTRDICPSVALLLDRYPQIRTADMREAVDRYIDCRLKGCVRVSARLGDMRRLRSLKGLYLRRPDPADRLILALARLPRPLARAAFALGLGAKALLRGLKRASRALGWTWGADPRLVWRVPRSRRAG